MLNVSFYLLCRLVWIWKNWMNGWHFYWEDCHLHQPSHVICRYQLYGNNLRMFIFTIFLLIMFIVLKSLEFDLRLTNIYATFQHITIKVKKSEWGPCVLKWDFPPSPCIKLITANLLTAGEPHYNCFSCICKLQFFPDWST